MKSWDQQKSQTSKKLPSIIPKQYNLNEGKTTSQSGKTQSENLEQQVSATRKYLSHHLEPQISISQNDPTQKFLLQTRRKLESSTLQLNQFHRKRQSYKSAKQNISFEIINNEIKTTKQKLKNKHYTKSKITDVQNEKNQNSIKQNKNTLLQNQLELSAKLKILQKALSKEQFSDFEQQIKQKIKFLRKKYSQNVHLQQKILKYYSSYEILSKFLQQIVKDTKLLIFKQQNIQIYYKMKQQMIGLLSNEQFFKNHLTEIQQKQTERQNSLLVKTIYQQERFTKTNSWIRGKGKCYTTVNSLGNSSQKTLTDKIQELFQISKNNIKQAFFNFNKPYLMYEIQLQFNNRFKTLNKAILTE